MKHNAIPQPYNKILAATIALLGVFSLEACSADSPAPQSISQSTEATPSAMAPNTPSSLNADPMARAHEDLTTTAKAVGRRLLDDINNTKSGSREYAGTYQGNGQDISINPSAARVPAMTAYYLANEKSLTISATNSPNSQEPINLITLQFNVGGATAARFESEIAAHNNVGASEFQDALQGPDVEVSYVNLIDNSNVRHEESLTGGLNLTRFDGSASNQPLDGSSAPSLVTDFDSHMNNVEKSLSSQLNF